MILLYFDFRGDDVPGSGVCPDYPPGDRHPVPASGPKTPDRVKLQIWPHDHKLRIFLSQKFKLL